ncbi:hypothetical protein BP50_000248 [Kingella potus DSM 18304]
MEDKPLHLSDLPDLRDWLFSPIRNPQKCGFFYARLHPLFCLSNGKRGRRALCPPVSLCRSVNPPFVFRPRV